MPSETYHESELSEGTRDIHRALASLREELDAIDWYQQRIDATSDRELAAVLAHNRDEEIEHAAMVLEWIRRKAPVFDRVLKTYLFTEAPIVQIEEGAEADEVPARPAVNGRSERTSPSVGSLIDDSHLPPGTAR